MIEGLRRTNALPDARALIARTVRAVLFDVDGTLVDSIPLLVECFRHAARAELLREIDDATILPLVGRPLDEMFRLVHPEICDEQNARCVLAYREAYRPHAATRSPLFPDARACVENFVDRELKLGVVSGKTVEGIHRVLGDTNLLERFDVVVGADSGAAGKPSPEGALLAARELCADPADTLVVGDSLLDVRMGRSAGMLTCGVATGTASRAELERESHVVVDSLADLAAIFV